MNTTNVDESNAVNGMTELSQNSTDEIDENETVNSIIELHQNTTDVDEKGAINYITIELSDSTTNRDEGNATNDMIELSDVDKSNEAAAVALFGSESNPVGPCCKVLRCNKRIKKDIAVRHRLSFQELSKGEQDLIILSQLQAHRRIPEFQDLYGADTKRKRSRVKKTPDAARKTVKYYFCDLQICQKMFLFIHDLGSGRFENLCRHYDTEGISFRRHKLANRPASRPNILTPLDIYSVKDFITSYGDQYGHPLLKNFKCVKLPPTETVSSMHKKYCNSIELREDVRAIARTTFRKIWKKYCPYVTVTKSDQTDKFK